MASTKTFPKYMLFSGHDTNIGNIWAYLQPIDFKQDNLKGQFVDWYHIPFSSSIQIELHKKVDCSSEKGSTKCFYIQFTSNGQPLVFRDLPSIHNEAGMSFSQSQSNFDLKTPGQYDASNKERNQRYQRGMYSYDKAKDYLQKISFKGK